MRNTPSIDLGRMPADAQDAPFDPSPRVATLKRARRAVLADFTTKELKDELLDRNVTDFSRITPWLKCALLLVIFALVVLTNIGMKCMDGELYGFACTIAQ
jgi:hypothetical protein